MKVGGFLKFSTLDYPGKLSSVIFCQGCSLRCVYCHNPDLQDCSKPGNIEFSDVLSFLKSRVGLLDAVVFSGGEPLLQPGLKEAMIEVRKLGFLVGIHTSGILPQVFESILNTVDWVGFDIKTIFETYERITGINDSGKYAQTSFEQLLLSDTEYEVRTTFDPRFISAKDLVSIAQYLCKNGVQKWVLQECILRNEENAKLLLPNELIIDELEQYIKVELRKE